MTERSIASTTPLREMGLDSLMAVELRNVLVRLGGQSLPATLLFDYPHLDALTSHLYSGLGPRFRCGLDAGGRGERRARAMSILPISPTRKRKPCCWRNWRMATARRRHR